jgi:Nucleotide modification associated domain 3
VNVVVLRVGIDTAEGGINGPLLANGAFEFIPIPDDKHGVDQRTYGNTIGRHGRALMEYFPARRRSHVADIPMHVDPEFETFTYGDPTPPKKSLARLSRGDMLVFYAGLEGWDFECAPALYIIGYFEVEIAGVGSSFSEAVLHKSFGGNFHVMHKDVFARERDKVILIKGSPQSRLLTKAVKVGERQRLPAGSWWQLITPEMAKVFGRFGGIGSLQRSSPRWVEAAYIQTAASFVRSLY